MSGLLNRVKINYTIIFLNILELFSRPRLKRVPEPEAISDFEEQVSNFNRVMETPLSISYAMMLQKMLDVSQRERPIKYLDLCCGPAHFAKLVPKFFKVDKMGLVDMSGNMLELAKQVLSDVDVDKNFVNEDVTQLSSVEDSQYDLITLLNGLHHLPELKDVTSAFSSMERVSRENGMIFIIDMVRPKNQFMLNLYTETFGAVYSDLGLDYFKKDFV